MGFWQHSQIFCIFELQKKQKKQNKTKKTVVLNLEKCMAFVFCLQMSTRAYTNPLLPAILV